MGAIASSKAANISSQTSVVKARIQQKYKFWRVPDSVAAFSAQDTRSGEARARIVMDVIFKVACLSLKAAPVVVAGTPIEMAEHLAYMTLIGTLFFTVIDAPPSHPTLVAATIDIAPTTVALVGAHIERELALETHMINGGACDQTAEPALSLLASFNALRTALGFPAWTAISDVELATTLACGGSMERACYLALLVYLCGKPVAAKFDAVSVNRPRNLEAKFNQGGKFETLSGELKMSEHGARRIGYAWEIDGVFRYGFFWPLHNLPKQQNDPTLSAVATMVALLDMAQLAHVKIIIDFFQMFPWAVDLRGVAREINTLAHDAKIWAGYPLEEQPFAKLIHRDQFKAFDSKSLHRLIALANDMLVASQPTVSGYNIKGADADLVNEFNNLRALRAPPPPDANDQSASVPTI